MPGEQVELVEALAILEKHGALSDELAAQLPEAARAAWYHLTSMYSHRGDGIPTQYTYPVEVRDAAKALVRAALAERADINAEIAAAVKAAYERCAAIADEAHHASDLSWTPRAIATAIRGDAP